MAEHMNQTVEPELDGFNRMGKPLSEQARSAAYEHCKAMGLNSARAWECVSSIANQLEHDKPYEAQDWNLSPDGCSTNSIAKEG